MAAEWERKRRGARHPGQFNHPRCGPGLETRGAPHGPCRRLVQGAEVASQPPGSGPRPSAWGTVQTRQGSALDATLLLINPREAARQQRLGKVCRARRARVRTNATGRLPGRLRDLGSVCKDRERKLGVV